MIRTLTARDLAEYRPLRLRALKDHPKAFGASYREALRLKPKDWRQRLSVTPGCSMLGAFVDGRLVGTVGYVRESHEKESHRVLIWGVYVVPEVRRNGVARSLMKAAIKRIGRMRGVDTVVLSVSESTPAARALYISLGFRPYGLDRRALKVDGRFVAEEPMALALR